MTVFNKKNLINQTFLQKLFNKQPIQNFIIELENYLSENEDNINNLLPNALTALVQKYRVNFIKSYQYDRKRLFELYLKKVLEDEKITENEMTALKILQRFLYLSDEDVGCLLKAKTDELYQQKVKEALEDEQLEPSERISLELLRKNLLLSEETAKDIYAAEASQKYNDYLNTMIADKRLSPAEDKQLQELAKNLGVKVNNDDATMNLLNKYRLFWTIENGQIPSIQADINLQKSECLYFKTNIDWYEMRTVTRRINYNGTSARIRICKGVYYTIGSISPEKVTENIWKLIDTGTLYVTSKRLIFMGSNSNKNIRFNKVLAFEPYSDGVQIEKDTGRPVLFGFTDNIDIFSVLLSRLINNN